MALVEKNDIKQIFADQAPSIDKPASFANYPRGWDTARPNNGKPTIKQFNYLQQRTDQNILWMHQNGAALPYDSTMEYAEGAVVVKDGKLQQKQGGSWVNVGVSTAAELMDASGGSQQGINDLAGYSQLLFKNYDDLRNYTDLGTRIFIYGEWLRGSFVFDESDTSSVDNGGTIIVDSLGRRWKREFNGAVKAYWFGAPTEVNDQVQINAAANAAIYHKELVDIRGVTWGINGSIKFPATANGVITNLRTRISVDVNGNYPSGYAVEIGDPSVTFSNGRVNGFKVQGHLLVAARSRGTALNGVYLKGSWFNIDFIRATDFNGEGINIDSVWDSNISHLSVERCGNASKFAFLFSSNGDTSNCTTIDNIQCEQAYELGMRVDAIRTTINNIHAERMSITDTSLAQNHRITLNNSTILQAVIHSLTSSEKTRLDLYAASAENFVCSGDVFTNYGIGQAIKSLRCKSYTQGGTAKQITLDTCSIDTLRTLDDVTVIDSAITTYNPAFNSSNVTFTGGSIDTINCSSNIRGNIDYFGTKINTILDTRAPASGYSAMEYHGCNIQTYNGAFNAQAKFIGGSIQTANIASQAKPTFESVAFKDFNPTGVGAYITRNCTATGTVVWGLPTVAFGSGTITERIGYSADGKIYQNTDGATNWAKLA